jgi:hypothetical protein
MKAGDLFVDASEIVETFARSLAPVSAVPPTIIIVGLAISAAGDEPSSRV